MQNLKFTVNAYSFTHRGDIAGLIGYIRLAESLGVDGVRFLDHVLSVDMRRHSHLPEMAYDSHSQFHEPFTLMAYLAAHSTRIRLVTGVLVLAQRQAALVAKQAAEVDILSGGRVTLGVGIGYNQVEYEAMGGVWKDRGLLFEEQVEVMRRLWTEERVDFQGRWHRLEGVYLNPRPIQRPIPLWFGTGRLKAPIPPDRVLQRIARLADAWCPQFRIPEGESTLAAEARQCIAKVNAYAREFGRPPGVPGLELSLFPTGKSRATLRDEVEVFRSLGASHIHVRPNGPSAQDQARGLESFMEIAAATPG